MDSNSTGPAPRRSAAACRELHTRRGQPPPPTPPPTPHLHRWASTSCTTARRYRHRRVSTSTMRRRLPCSVNSSTWPGRSNSRYVPSAVGPGVGGVGGWGVGGGSAVHAASGCQAAGRAPASRAGSSRRHRPCAAEVGLGCAGLGPPQFVARTDSRMAHGSGPPSLACFLRRSVSGQAAPADLVPGERQGARLTPPQPHPPYPPPHKTTTQQQ